MRNSSKIVGNFLPGWDNAFLIKVKRLGYRSYTFALVYAQQRGTEVILCAGVPLPKIKEALELIASGFKANKSLVEMFWPAKDVVSILLFDTHLLLGLSEKGFLTWLQLAKSSLMAILNQEEQSKTTPE